MITEPQAQMVTAYLRDVQAIAARDFYRGDRDKAAGWMMRWLGVLLDAHASGVSPAQAVAACRSNKFSPLRMGKIE